MRVEGEAGGEGLWPDLFTFFVRIRDMLVLQFDPLRKNKPIQHSTIGDNHNI